MQLIEASNYGIVTCPIIEWHFVVDPTQYEKSGELAAAMKEIDARYADEHGHELSRPAWPDESKLHHLSDGEREQRCRALARARRV